MASHRARIVISSAVCVPGGIGALAGGQKFSYSGAMKTDTHPKYFPAASVTCACGAVMVMGSTKEKLSVEICSNCHPFYTGNEKVMDTAGRVEKFKAHRAAANKTVKKSK
jgi:large subunit ribosomal protein L31